MASNPRPKSQSSADSVSTDLPPHLVQQLKRMLEAELPGIRVFIDEPRSRDGEWWLDLAVENVELPVAWRPKFGSGLFEGAEYGARPSEIYREPKSACVRIQQLVAGARHASRAGHFPAADPPSRWHVADTTGRHSWLQSISRRHRPHG